MEERGAGVRGGRGRAREELVEAEGPLGREVHLQLGQVGGQVEGQLVGLEEEGAQGGEVGRGGVARGQRWAIAIETKIQLPSTLPIVLNCVIGIIN